MKSLSLALAAALIAAGPALAAEPGETPARIRVLATGVVETPPDIATLSFGIIGEGQTSDAAASALVAKKTAIETAIARFAGTKAELRTGELALREAHKGNCDADSYNRTARLSDGPCAVAGYVAAIEVTVRVTPVNDAGTILGLAARLGATNARVSNFTLKDGKDAYRRATVAAMADGRAQADAIITATGAHLGRLVSVEDSRSGRGETSEIIVTASRVPAAPAPPPIVLKIQPRPITTTAELVLTYEVAR